MKTILPAALAVPALVNLNDHSVMSLSPEKFNRWAEEMEEQAFGWNDIMQDGEHKGEAVSNLTDEQLRELDYYGFPLRKDVLDAIWETRPAN
jgi:uncharacterized protein (DUF1786 family)